MKTEKLDNLHTLFLEKPPTPKQEQAAEDAWREASKRLARQKADMLRAVAKQKEIAAERKEHTAKAKQELAEMERELEELKQRHKMRCVKLDAEDRSISGKASKAYDTILTLAKTGREAKAALGKAAEALVVTHGKGPIQIGKATYDFGCHGEHVYLVPRARKGK